ncbi:MAG: thiol protease/hemagglutinin PrtT [Bacteroidales bacterium]|nr:thiol protease/hemagglutinin PrtT [Bacteroidales bacterium]
MKKILSLFCVLAMASLVTAGPVNQQTAERVARNFWNAHRDKGVVQLDVPMLALPTQWDAFYIFVPNKAEGFVIVSADDAVTPILAYSFDSPANDTPNPEVSYWLSCYQEQIEICRTQNQQPTAEITKDWNSYVTGQIDPQPLTAVSPLLTTNWDQSPNYNKFCPYNSNYSQLTVVGCVATAMAQIMKYWNYPVTGRRNYSYTRSPYGTIAVNFATAVYDWGNMPNSISSTSPTAKIDAVALLSYHCGVAVRMSYDVSANGGSGAYMCSSSSTPSSQNAFVNYFGYSSNLTSRYRSNTSESVWNSLVKAEIDANRPVMYVGYDSSAGHCFVCDGYNSNEKYHFNWGWSGAYNGYYYLNALNLGGGGTGSNSTYTFNMGQQILLNLYPGSIAPEFATTAADIISSFPYTMDFDGDISRLKYANYDADGVQWTVANNSGINGSKAAMVGRGEKADDWIVLPAIATAGTYTISWKAKAALQANPESYQVWIGDSLIYREAITNTSFTERSTTFHVAANDTVRVAFRYISEGKSAFTIDDVVINNVSSPTLYNVNLSSASSTMGTVTGSGRYTIGTAVTISATANNGYRFTHWSDNDSLNPRTLIVSSDTSLVANFEAYTPPDTCAIASFPYHMNFDGGLDCIRLRDNNGDGVTWSIYSGRGYNGTRCAGIQGARNADDYLFMPAINTPDTYYLSWKARAYMRTFAEKYQVYVGTEMLFSESLKDTNYVDRQVIFTVAPGQSVKVQFRYIANNKKYLFIDNVEIGRYVAPLCTDVFHDTAVRACQSYTWKGQTYTTTGTYTHTSTGAVTGGCDSTYQLRLFLGRPTSDTTRATLDSTTFTWCGEDYTSTGIYTKNYTNIYGCDSIKVLILTDKLSINDIEPNNIHVYPNPTSGELNISDIEPSATIEVIDQTGRTVLKTQGTTGLSLRTFPEGIYFLRITDCNGTHIARVVKQ